MIYLAPLAMELAWLCPDRDLRSQGESPWALGTSSTGLSVWENVAGQPTGTEDGLGGQFDDEGKEAIYKLPEQDNDRGCTVSEDGQRVKQ